MFAERDLDAPSLWNQVKSTRCGGWGSCSASCWQEMALLHTLPVGELKWKEWKVNIIYIWPKFLYKLTCVRICISFFLTRTWHASLNVFQMREEIAGKPSLTFGAHANPKMEQLAIMYHRQWNHTFLEKHLMVTWRGLKFYLNAFKAAVFIGNILGKFVPLLSILQHTKNFTNSSEIQVLLAFPLNHDASLDLIYYWCWINRSSCEQSSAQSSNSSPRGF